MGADQRALLHHVILPGALPYILTGLRLGLAQAWRILVGVEMLAAVPWGLGWMIFGARGFLNTDVMLAGVAVIGVIGLALEKLGSSASSNLPSFAGECWRERRDRSRAIGLARGYHACAGGRRL